jgi:hypothetical protein
MKNWLAVALLSLIASVASSVAVAATITIQGTSPSASMPPVGGTTITVDGTSPGSGLNYFPFGGATSDWGPFMGFVYQNVPPFTLNPGDTLAFDLDAQNNIDIQLQIDLAATTTSGGDNPAGSFTKIVSNTQTPQNPRGDTTHGNFELKFSVESTFHFPGGGLIIRFSNPSSSYAADSTATGVLHGYASTDSSGYFVERFLRDPDGVFPWTGTIYSDYIGGFQVVTNDVVPAAPVPALDRYSLTMMAVAMLLLGFWGIRRARR